MKQVWVSTRLRKHYTYTVHLNPGNVADTEDGLIFFIYVDVLFLFWSIGSHHPHGQPGEWQILAKPDKGFLREVGPSRQLRMENQEHRVS